MRVLASTPIFMLNSTSSAKELARNRIQCSMGSVINVTESDGALDIQVSSPLRASDTVTAFPASIGARSNALT